MVTVSWAEPALADLASIAEYIALDNPDAASRFVARVFEAVDQLESFPHSGRHPPEMPHSEYRELIVTPCRVFYRATDKAVLILHVMRSERLLNLFLLDERG